MTLLSIIKNHYQEAVMNNYPVKGFIEKTKVAFKRVTGKLAGEKVSTTRNEVGESNSNVQTGHVQADHDEVKDGVKKAT